MNSYKHLREKMYQDFYKSFGRSELLVKIWSDAFGPNYLKELRNFGFVTKEDLETTSLYLQADNGSSLLDIGCGTGGPGLWIAQKNHLKLTGIDIVQDAVNHAKEFKNNFDLVHDSEFSIGGFDDIPLEANSIDNVMSIDAFWMVKEKVRALQEVKRVMNRGGKFILTTWESTLNNSSFLFIENGFEIISKNVTRNWKEYQLKVYGDILKYRNELIDEIGESANILISEAENAPAMLESNKRYIYYTVIR